MTLWEQSLTLLTAAGCKNREQEAWQQGYDAYRSAAYREGWREGSPRGTLEGDKQGRAAAERAAHTGRAWRLYSTPAYLALFFGAIVGIAVQYTILVCINDAGRMPELVTVAFVPAVRHSVAYTVLESRRRLLMWWEDEMRRLAAAEHLQRAQIQTVHDTIARKLRAMTSLQELTQARLLDLTRQELSRIVSGAEQAAFSHKERIVACPHCGKAVRFPRKKAGKTVNCPYARCGLPFHIPPLHDGN